MALDRYDGGPVGPRDVQPGKRPLLEAMQMPTDPIGQLNVQG